MCGGLAAFLFARPEGSCAKDYAEFRVSAPNLEARFQYWRNRAMGFAQYLAVSDHLSIVQFRRSLAAVPTDRGLQPFLRAVNIVVNTAATYKDDYRSDGGRDQWASPIELLEQGGDCEDFALAKAATLQCLGWPIDSTYLLVGLLDRLSSEPIGHAVLVAVLGDRQDMHFVLDTVANNVSGLHRYHGFRPIYSVGSRRVTMFIPAKD